VSDAAVEAVRDAVRLDDALTLHGTPAVRSASDALGAVRRARLDAVGGGAGGGER
jgi:hypothetical protein